MRENNAKYWNVETSLSMNDCKRALRAGIRCGKGIPERARGIVLGGAFRLRLQERFGAQNGGGCTLYGRFAARPTGGTEIICREYMSESDPLRWLAALPALLWVVFAVRGEGLAAAVCWVLFALAVAFIALCVAAAFKMDKDLELQAELREFIRKTLQAEEIKERSH